MHPVSLTPCDNKSEIPTGLSPVFSGLHFPIICLMRLTCVLWNLLLGIFELSFPVEALSCQSTQRSSDMNLNLLQSISIDNSAGATHLLCQDTPDKDVWSRLVNIRLMSELSQLMTLKQASISTNHSNHSLLIHPIYYWCHPLLFLGNVALSLRSDHTMTLHVCLHP
jgi:hypothetical protein